MTLHFITLGELDGLIAKVRDEGHADFVMFSKEFRWFFDSGRSGLRSCAIGRVLY